MKPDPILPNENEINQPGNTGEEMFIDDQLASEAQDLDTRGESGNLVESQGYSAGPGEATSGRNKTLEGIRQGRDET